MAFVRQSKLRHVFGEPCKKDLRVEGVKCVSAAYDGATVAANAKLLAVAVSSAGGGSFRVFPVESSGRIDPKISPVSAHSENITDMAWNPFQDNMLATSSDGGSIKLWEISSAYGLSGSAKLLLELNYRQKRCSQLLWHPTAKNVLLSVSLEPCVKVRNLDSGEDICSIDETELPSPVYCADFSPDGTKFVTSSKDKKFRIYNARSGELLQEGDGHKGGKAQRIIFVSNNRLFSTGFSTMSKRQYSVWDANDLSKHLMQDSLDTSNAVLVPFFNPGLKLLFIYGRGDTVIRSYEITETHPYIHYIDMYQSKDPQRGIGTFPLYAVNISNKEVVRFYKHLDGPNSKGIVESVHFTVPRKSDLFQDDLYPDTPSNVAALTASEWESGMDKPPNMYSFLDAYNKEAKDKQSTKGKGGLGGGGLSGGLSGPKSAAAAKPAPPKETPVEKKTTRSPSPPPAAKEPVKQQSHAPAAASTPKVDTSKLEAEIKELREIISKQANVADEVEALKEMVKKQNERITVLESLVQEESDEEK